MKTRRQTDPFHNMAKFAMSGPVDPWFGGEDPTAAQKLAEAHDTASRRPTVNAETVHFRPFHASIPPMPTAKQSDALEHATALRPPTPGGEGLGTTFHVGSVELDDGAESDRVRVPDAAPAGEAHKAMADNSAPTSNHLLRIPKPPCWPPDSIIQGESSTRRDVLVEINRNSPAPFMRPSAPGCSNRGEGKGQLYANDTGTIAYGTPP
jgi:hypothetical protein